MASRITKLARSTLVAVNARKTPTLCRHQGLLRPALSRAAEVLGANSVGSSGISSLASSRDGVSSLKLFGGAVGTNLRQPHCQLPSRAYSTGTASSSQINQSEFAEMAWEGLVGAVDAANMSRQQIVESEHLMKALLEQKDGLVRRIFTKAGVDNTAVLQATGDFINQQSKVGGDISGPILGPNLISLLDNAKKYKKEIGDSFLSVEHFLLAFNSDKRFGQQLFKNLQLGEKELKEAVTSVRGNQRVTDQNPEGKYEALYKYGKDLTELARRGKLDPVIGRDDEIRLCIQILSRRTKNNPVLIGEPGVGNTAIAEGLAQRIVRGDVPESLLNRKLISLDMGSLVAGAKFRGDFEERVKAVLKEVTASNGQIILFIEDILILVGAATMSATSISAGVNNILMLNGTNFKDWKENVLIVLGCMDLDLALRIEQPAPLTDASTPDSRKYFEKWERSNRMSLMLIKRGIPEAFRGAISAGVTNASEFLTELEKRFAKNDKAETNTLLASLISLKYKGKGNIREYIMEMSHLASKLKALKLELYEDLLVHLVLISLPPQYSQFKVSYNCQKEKWTLNELISYCVQEEDRLKQDITESAHFASTSKDKGTKRKKENEAAKR